MYKDDKSWVRNDKIDPSERPHLDEVLPGTLGVEDQKYGNRLEEGNFTLDTKQRLVTLRRFHYSIVKTLI